MTRRWAIGVLLLVSGAADATVLCQRRNGDLALRDRCREREKTVEIGQLGLATAGPRGERGEQGPRGEAGPQGSPGMCVAPRIVDARNEDVGAILELQPTKARVMRAHGGDLFFFDLGPSKFFPWSGGDGSDDSWLDHYAPYYETPECSGPRHAVPFLPVDAPTFGDGLLLIAPPSGAAAYYTRREEAVARAGYSVDLVVGHTPDDATRNCTLGCLQPEVYNRSYTPGTLVAPVEPCAWNPSLSCARCCRRVGLCTGEASRVFEPTDLRIAPFHRAEFSDLGLEPPFTLVP